MKGEVTFCVVLLQLFRAYRFMYKRKNESFGTFSIWYTKFKVTFLSALLHANLGG